MNQGQRIKNLNMNGYQQFNKLIIIKLYCIFKKLSIFKSSIFTRKSI